MRAQRPRDTRQSRWPPHRSAALWRRWSPPNHAPRPAGRTQGTRGCDGLEAGPGSRSASRRPSRVALSMIRRGSRARPPRSCRRTRAPGHAAAAAPRPPPSSRASPSGRRRRRRPPPRRRRADSPGRTPARPAARWRRMRTACSTTPTPPRPPFSCRGSPLSIPDPTAGSGTRTKRRVQNKAAGSAKRTPAAAVAPAATRRLS